MELLLLGLLACNPDGFEGADTGTSPATGANPMPGCDEVDAVTIASPDEVVDAAWVQAADLLAEHEGTWTGVLDGTPRGSFDLTLTLAWDGQPMTWRDLQTPLSGGTTTGYGIGAPSSSCADDWTIGLVARVDAPPELTVESMALQLVATAEGLANLAGSVDQAEVTGDSAPTAFDPADWDAVALSLFGVYEGATWSGTLAWNAANEGDTTTGTGATATGATGSGTGVGTGVATAPSGAVETAGEFEVQRP